MGARPTNIVNIEVPPWRFSVREVQIMFGVLITAALVETAARVVEAWDGSNYLFSVLEYRSAFAPHHRLTDDVVEWFVSQIVIKSINNVHVIELAFGLTYALIPVASLGLCWWIVRRHDMTLIMWPALAMLATTPGFIFQVAESSVMTWMAWPVICLAIVRPDRYEMNAVGAALTVLVFLAHPLAPLMLLIILAAYVASSLVRGTWVRQTTSVSIALGLAAVVRPFVLNDAYDSSAFSLAMVRNEFRASVAGWPMVVFVSVLVAAALCLVCRRSSELAVPTGLLVVAAAGLALWVAHPAAWAAEADYRDFTVLLSMPFMILAVLDGTKVLGWLIPQRQHGSPPSAAATGRFRLRMALGASVVVAAIAGVQSAQFSDLRSELASRLTGLAGRCVAVDSLGFHSTPLDHWSLATLGTLVQGRDQKVLLVHTSADCELYERTGSLDLRGFAPVPADVVRTGWFHFPPPGG